MSKSGGVFQIDDVTRTMSKGGGVRLVFHPSKFRPPPPQPGWLATGLVCVYIYYVLWVETTELYTGPHICDGTYNRVGSPGKIWLTQIGVLERFEVT